MHKGDLNTKVQEWEQRESRKTCFSTEGWVSFLLVIP